MIKAATNISLHATAGPNHAIQGAKLERCEAFTNRGNAHAVPLRCLTVGSRNVRRQTCTDQVGEQARQHPGIRPDRAPHATCAHLSRKVVQTQNLNRTSCVFFC